MATADAVLKRAVLGLSVLLLVLLVAAALYSAGGWLFDGEPTASADPSVAQPSAADADDEQQVTGTADLPDPSGPAVEATNDRLVVGDDTFPFTISCLRQPDPDGQVDNDVYVVVVHNRGQESVDYLIQADLVGPEGPTASAVATIDRLRPDEEREAVLVPDGPFTGPATCSIRVVQGDRRVLLAN